MSRPHILHRHSLMHPQMNNLVELVWPINKGRVVASFHSVLGTWFGNATCGAANTYIGEDAPLVQLISAFDSETRCS